MTNPDMVTYGAYWHIPGRESARARILVGALAPTPLLPGGVRNAELGPMPPIEAGDRSSPSPRRPTPTARKGHRGMDGAEEKNMRVINVGKRKPPESTGNLSVFFYYYSSFPIVRIKFLFSLVRGN